MKKCVLIIIIFFTALVIQIPIVNAADGDSEEDKSFVSEAFSATKEFLQEDLPEDDVGIITNAGLFFVTDAIKGINRILIIALAGIGAIALSIVGIKYIRGISSPAKVREARQMLNTVLRGLGFGFGAFVIWEIAMLVVTLIIDVLATN